MERSNGGNGTIYCFGDYRFEPARQLLLRGDAPVRLGGRALDLLHALVAHPGEVVGKDALIRAAWPNIFVHESNLKVNIAALRRALPRAATDLPYIATVPGRGYRFVAPVRIYGGPRDAPVPAEIIDRSGGLPVSPELIGREAVMDELAARLRSGGLLTIVGPAGVGKTTVGVATARALRQHYPDGVCFVDLAAIGDPQLVGAAIAVALGIGSHLTDVLAGLVEALRDRSMLLLLDNCEHVLSAAATIAEHLRLALPAIHIIATSREPLHSRTETLYRLPALGCPGEAEGGAIGADAALGFPAIELLVTRAAEAHGFHLADADAPAIAAICRRLDGIALAIELAAPRLASCDAATLLSLLERSFEPLAAAPHAGPARHQTLLATLDWSYRLLSDDEARLLRWLAVFAGGFTLDDVVGLAGDLGHGAEAVATALESLVAKSLVAAAYSAGGLRYRLLDSTRSFAAERLRTSGEEAAALAGHARHLLRSIEQAEEEWHWRAREDWTGRHGHRANDLRRAIDWAFGAGVDPALGLRLTAAAIPLWDELSSVGESRLRVERALAAGDALEGGGDPALRMKLMAAHASNRNFSDDLGDATEAAWTEGWRLAAAVGNVDYQLRCLWGLAVLQTFTGRHRDALATLGRFAAVGRASDRSAVPDGERLRLMTGFYCGDIQGARQGLGEMAQEHDRLANRARVSRFQLDRFVAIRGSLAMASWVTGEHRRAAALAQEALDGAVSLGHLVSHSNALALTALPITVWSGAIDAAERQVEGLVHNLGLREIAVWRPVSRFYRGAILSARGDAEGVTAMRTAIGELIASHFLIRVPIYLAMLAEAALRHGRVEIARTAVNAALERAERQSEHWCRPELLRVRGLLLHRDGDLFAAEQTLLQAVQLAWESGAHSFRLRAATDLAGLWLQADRPSAAAALLAPAIGRFGEDEDSVDVARARAMMAALAVERPNGDGVSV